MIVLQKHLNNYIEYNSNPLSRRVNSNIYEKLRLMLKSWSYPNAPSVLKTHSSRGHFARHAWTICNWRRKFEIYVGNCRA